MTMHNLPATARPLATTTVKLKLANGTTRWMTVAYSYAQRRYHLELAGYLGGPPLFCRGDMTEAEYTALLADLTGKAPEGDAS
jgi:hypothetical protein